MKRSTTTWRHSDVSHPYDDKQTRWSDSLSKSSHYQRSSENKVIIQDVKDKELETVMIAIHNFFVKKSEDKSYANGASKSVLCDHVLKHADGLTISKFRFALNSASRLKLVQNIMSDGCMKIKV